MTAVVYRCFSCDGDLLYIGSTGNIERRLLTHSSQTEWWDEVCCVDREYFATLNEARLVEKEAIGLEHPQYNEVRYFMRRAPHGTFERYRAKCRCALCRRANTDFVLAENRRRAERLAADPSLVPHGRASTYNNWGCRCESCVQANTASCAKYKRERRSA